MTYGLITLLLACLLVITSSANENVGALDTVWHGFDLEDSNQVEEARAMEGPVISPRTEAAATVTVTETICGSDELTSIGDSPIISIPETSLVTYTSESSSVPTSDQLPSSSGTDGAPSAEPISAEAPTSPPAEQTTALQTSSPASSSSSFVDVNETPTWTSDSLASTAAPTANTGRTQGGMSGVIPALALTFVPLFAV